jgi:sec-independent protein translocase protein TatB
MFDFAWSEIAVIAMVALVVIGPKDLPKALRMVGTWVGRARSIAREFQNSLDQMIREAELEEVRKTLETAASVDVAQAIETTIDPGGELKRSLAEPLLPEAAAATPAASPPGPEPAEPGAGATPEPATATPEEPTVKSATHG